MEAHKVTLIKLYSTTVPKFKIKVEDEDLGSSNITVTENDLLEIINMFYDQQEAEEPCPACGREADMF